MATIKDVAREANVAISTVSNVLNHVDVVKPDTIEKVLEAVKKLNYTPNLNGKYLKKSETKLLGLFITNLEGPFYNDLISAMYSRCCKNDYNMTIFLNNEKNLMDSYQAILGKRVDGAIILNHTIRDSHIETFQNLEMPIVFLDREIQSHTITSVVIDNYNGMKQSCEYLIDSGHQRIGYVHGNKGNYDETMRYLGYIETLTKHGIEPRHEWQIQGHFAQQEAYSEIRKYVGSGKELPDAFVCANDEMAIGCIEALEKEGFHVPQDISIVGFDNIDKTNYFIPRITTVDTGVKELGRTAVDQLIRILNKEKITNVCKIPSTLIVRDSCSITLHKS